MEDQKLPHDGITTLQRTKKTLADNRFLTSTLAIHTRPFTQDTAAMDTKMVASFPNLSADVRKNIWLLALSPRVVGAVPTYKPHQKMRLLSDVHLPAVLTVNRESRAVTRHLYHEFFVPHTKEKPGQWISRIWFNPAIDTWRTSPYVIVDNETGNVMITKDPFPVYVSPGLRLATDQEIVTTGSYGVQFSCFISDLDECMKVRMKKSHLPSVSFTLASQGLCQGWPDMIWVGSATVLPPSYVPRL